VTPHLTSSNQNHLMIWWGEKQICHFHNLVSLGLIYSWALLCFWLVPWNVPYEDIGVVFRLFSLSRIASLSRFLLVAIYLNSTHIQALLRGPAYEKNSMHTPVVVMSRLYWLFGNKMCFELWVNISNSSGYIDWLENGCRRSD